MFILHNTLSYYTTGLNSNLNKEAKTLSFERNINGYNLICDRNILVTSKQRYKHTDKTITKIWDITTNKFNCLATLPDNNASSAFISSNAQAIISCHTNDYSSSTKFKIWGIK